MVKGLGTICRTIMVVSVWVSTSMFLTFGLPNFKVQGRSEEIMVFSVIVVLIGIMGALLATVAILLIRPKKKRIPSPDRAFEVMPIPKDLQK